ncbi:hypothetical protein GCM10023258_14660 [Terrabacter aeriphilus]|uniref:Uncharacterized protein n=1 Tax=Terrabacter aeriphilus TaxID=515662 RepID=A0ABP9J9K9_9MICO
MGDRRHEVGERLAGAGAGLDEQVLARVDRVRHGVGHLHLTGPLGAAHPRHRGVEEVVERGGSRHWIRVCRGDGRPRHLSPGRGTDVTPPSAPLSAPAPGHRSFIGV